jgi:hypothetical protein
LLNALYHVPGRGDFYTDHTGKVTYVEATYGGKTLNQDLHKPLPDVTYVVHSNVRNREAGGSSYAHVFVTDSESRTILAHTDRLSRGDAVRSEHTQTKTGNEGGDGYDGGHSYRTWAGGGGEYLNITAQLREINQFGKLGKLDPNYPNSFYDIEDIWRALLPDRPGPHPTIEVNIEKTCLPDEPRPLWYFVIYQVDDNLPIAKRFRNE